MWPKILLSSLIYSLIGALMLVQTNIVLAVASDPNNPITAAITSAIGAISPPSSPTPTPIPPPSPVPSSQPVTRVTQQVKTWMLIYRPAGNFFNVLGNDPAYFTRNTLILAMNEGSKQALNYTLADEDIHTEYNPPLLPNSTSYDYKQMFTKYDLCNQAKQKDIKAVILWADGLGEYGGGMWESAVTGNKGISTNGAVLPELCDKTIVIYGLNYTRGLAEALESYAHHLERVFGKFRGEYTNWSDRDSCGNAHNPPNSRFEYDRDNTASFQSDCRNFKADGTGQKESISCNAWGCSGEGWLKWWMQNMPSDWWTLIEAEPTPTPVATASATPQATATPSATPTPSPAATATPSAQPISSPINDDSPDCLKFWIFSICFSDFISPPISTPVVIPSPTPSPTPTPIATPAPTPTPVVTPVITSIFPNPATQGTQVKLTGSGFSYSSKLYIGGDLPAPDSFYSVSENGKSLTFVLTTEFDYRAGQILATFVQNGSIRSNVVNLTVAPSIVDSTPNLKANQKLIAPSLTLDEEHPEAVIVSTNFNTDITIPSSISKPTLKFSNISTNQNKVNAFFNNIININAETEAGTVKVQFPSLITISGPKSWNGIINAPQVKDNSTVKPNVDSGKSAIVSAVIEVGADDAPLTFEKGVRLLIPKQAGKLAGYQRGSTFAKITNNCSADTQAAGDKLSAAGDCYISVGNDMVIWTKHFTKFVTYTETSQPAGTTGSSGGGSTSSPGGSGPAVCVDGKPQSAPKLLSAKVTGRNTVTLTWSKATDPVSYYLVAYGTKPDSPDYGNPNIGGKDTTSYVVKGLNNGQTYYFKVRAGNHCAPGEFSNEMAIKASGDKVSAPAKGFKAGVLSIQNQTASADADLKFKPITEAKPERVVAGAGNIFARLISFLSHFFQR